MKQLIRLPRVRDCVGLSRSEIYRRIALGEFPPPIPIGARAVAWEAAAIDAWIKERIALAKKRAA
jgi:prophage regulatory protein